MPIRKGPVNYDPESPLDRVTGESLKANTALRDYYNLGPGRSLKRLHKLYTERREAGEILPPLRSQMTINNFSIRWEWQARVAAQTLIDAKAEKIALDQRRRELIEAEWNQSRTLKNLSDTILAQAPNFIKTSRRVIKGSPKVVDQQGRVLDPGTPEREVITMALDLNLAIKAATTGSSLGRLATNMITEKTGVEINQADSGEVDYSNVDDSAIRRALAQSGRLLMALSGREQLEPDEGPGPESGEPA